MDRHAGSLCACAHRLLGDEAAAEEVVQDVFVQLVRHGVAVERTAVTAWLYAVTLNRCRDLLRRSSFKSGLRTGPVADHLSQNLPDPHALVEDSERSRVLAGALQKLSPEMREAIVLRYASGLSYQEIAETLGCAAGTVASRLNRGLQRLGEELRTSGFSRENI